MVSAPVSLFFDSPKETGLFAAKMASRLSSGDTLLLAGNIGGGKTHFSRHLIQSSMDTPEDVPSPTFTLIQIYDTPRGEIWHSDLYRLTSLDEVEELGLAEAFSSAICLVEWPDKLGPLAPTDALTLQFETDPKHEFRRKITFDWTNPKWGTILDEIS